MEKKNYSLKSNKDGVFMIFEEPIKVLKLDANDAFTLAGDLAKYTKESLRKRNIRRDL
jgi:hypothetical protein